MAFTGVAVFQMITQNLVRITGLSLGAGASGTIGLARKTAAAEITIPAQFNPDVYTIDGGGGALDTVTLAESLAFEITPNQTGGITAAVPVNVAKTGTAPEDFQASLANPSGGATQGLEIYVRFKGG